MEALKVNSVLTIPSHELQVSFARSGGPGGQNVNKVESKVVLRFDVRASESLGPARKQTLLDKLSARLTTKGELLIHASSHRERHRNLEDARERMATLLAEALVQQRKRRKTKPTRGSQERRLRTKQKRSQIKRNRRATDE